MRIPIKKGLWITGFVVGFFALFGATGYLAATRSSPYHVSQILGNEHPETLAYKDYLQKYNDENRIYFLGLSQDLLEQSQKLFEMDRTLSRELIEFPGLKKVTSLSESQYLESHPNQLHLKRFFENGRLRPGALQLLKEDPFWKGSFVSEDGRSFLITTELRSGLSPQSEYAIVEKMLRLKSAMEGRFPGLKMHILGAKVAGYFFNQELHKQQVFVGPVTLAIVLVLLLFLFRSWVITFLCGLLVAISYCANAVLIFSFEGGLNPYTNFALMIAIVAALSEIIHYFSVYVYHTHGTVEDRLRQTHEKVFWPCLFTAGTTAIGFSSLCLSSIELIRHFGIYSCIGALFCFVANFYLLPPFILAFKIPLHLQRTEKENAVHAGKYLRWVSQKRRWILFAFGTLLAVSFYFSKNIIIDDNLYKKFVQDHPLTQAVTAFENQLHFTGSMDVLVTPKTRDIFDRSFEKELVLLEGKIRELKNVNQVRSVTDYFSYIRRTLRAPEEQSFHSNTHLQMVLDSLVRFKLLDGFWNKQNNEARLIVRLETLSSAKLMQTTLEIEKILQNLGMQGTVSGFSKVRVSVLQSILGDFMDEFTYSFITIFFVFLLLCRSFKWAFLAMIPNIAPVALLIGVIGALGIAVEDSLILTVSIFFGIAIDDTIHFFHGILDSIRKGHTVFESVEASFNHNIKSLSGTTLIFILTAPCFLLTDVFIFYKMAGFLGLAILIAFLADLLITPAILLKPDPSSRN